MPSLKADPTMVHLTCLVSPDIYCYFAQKRRSQGMRQISLNPNGELILSNVSLFVQFFFVVFFYNSFQAPFVKLLFIIIYFLLCQIGLTCLWMTKQPIKCCGSQKVVPKWPE